MGCLIAISVTLHFNIFKISNILVVDMTITMHDIKPIGLCVSTLELFDTRKFLLNYCDGQLIKGDDKNLVNRINEFRKELSRSQLKFLEGYKAIVASNIDKIIALVEARYGKTYSPDVGVVKKSGRKMIDMILNAQGFEMISSLENEFKTNIMQPTHRLFIDEMRKSH